MKRSPDNTVTAGRPAWPEFRSRWLRIILAGTALALATTALAPTASAARVLVIEPIVCEPEDKVCEGRREEQHQNFVETCKEIGGTLEGNGCVMQE
ncbi:hypothetical protein CDO26_02340 [Sinorhizobium meliloti]|nr:hypothetical protein CDO26_02340 [Sinorhizobium meliloti]RVJ69204.1 hypothetical protein CN171_23725 [Sinorhizobium meliloti]